MQSLCRIGALGGLICLVAGCGSALPLWQHSAAPPAAPIASEPVDPPDRIESGCQPALASLGRLFYLLWQGDHEHLNMAVSTDGGRRFGQRYIFDEWTTQASALCVHGGELFIAWKGRGNDQLNVGRVERAGERIIGLVKLQTFHATPHAPALASLGGTLYLAWQGVDQGTIMLAASADGGKSFGDPYAADETTDDAPAICSHNGRLYLAWKGDGNHGLNVAAVDVDGLDITGLQRLPSPPEISFDSPALASPALPRMETGRQQSDPG